MEIKNLVETAAAVTRVQTLHRGDVYKRIEENGGDATVIVGRVMDIASNGERTVVSVIEAMASSWGMPTIRSSAFTGDKDVIVFPLSDLELSVIAAPLFRQLEEARQEAEKRLQTVADRRGLLCRILETDKNDDMED
ncbi:hypothetical protein CS006_10520 [Bifidobacterium primatium]|uniref:Uncharacterized protein n=2 Tax=Bifidobacterium TaxID=1678 RepID=A0A2M9H6B3_9BIFI|nr:MULTISPECIES: hypothetical protein [Bifidobacterium]NEG95985.1 hypothetical protein [Bifidobacterium sp. SMB2]NEH12450.1 hypothetical protein [Bifidobacterium saimiriisciurei]PJM72361.1 hypothetical protein CS006_10520 [Bifidobacterium primatium]